MKIAYVTSRYPAISHTFVLREVEALRAQGLEIATFSIRRTGGNQLLSAADKAEHATTYAILPVRPLDLIAAHVGGFLRHPLAYLGTLLFSLRQHTPGIKGVVWQGFYFLEAIILWHQCKKRGIGHIHAHFANVAADAALLAATFGERAKSGPRTWSFTMHGPTEFFNVDAFKLPVKARLATFIACISDYCRSQLLAFTSDAVKLQIVHCGIDTDLFAAVDRRRTPTQILSVGRLVPEKGHAVLIEALALLHERGLPARLTLVGDGPERARLEAQAQRLQIDRYVTFAGSVGQDHIRQHYAAADVFCLPSFAEGVPVVLMEAMATGLPVVSSRIMGIPELIEENRSGLLTRPGRSDLLASALQRLLVNPHLRERLGAAGRNKVIAEFTSAANAARLAEMFRSLPTVHASASQVSAAKVDAAAVPVAAGAST